MGFASSSPHASSSYFPASSSAETIPPGANPCRQHPEFLGTWEGIPNSLEGFEDFLRASEVPFDRRREALRRSKTFVPKLEVRADGDKFLIVIPTANGPEIKEFVMDGTAFNSTYGPEKTPGTGQAYWDDGVMVLTVQMADKRTVCRRWVHQDTLIEHITLTTLGSVSVLKRAYRKVSDTKLP